MWKRKKWEKWQNLCIICGFSKKEKFGSVGIIFQEIFPFKEKVVCDNMIDNISVKHAKEEITILKPWLEEKCNFYQRMAALNR